mgnify:FL=1
MVAVVGLFHLWFLVLEMFLFTKPTGLETFHLSQQTANACATLAQNQGLYNGFLAAGLLLSLGLRSALLRRYSLGCVMVAGVYGAWSLGDPGPLIGQLVPGLLALVASELGERRATQTGAV